MNIQLVAALVVAVVLAGTHWKAYKVGENAVRAEWDKAVAAQVQQALADSEAKRMRERALTLANEGVQRDHELEKKRLAADAAAAAGRVRTLESALAAARGADTAAGPRADDPRGAIAGECAAALTALDNHAAGLRAQIAGLQGYTSKVCLAR